MSCGCLKPWCIPAILLICMGLGFAQQQEQQTAPTPQKTPSPQSAQTPQATPTAERAAPPSVPSSGNSVASCTDTSTTPAASQTPDNSSIDPISTGPQDSLAAVAARDRAAKTSHAKKVIGDDDLNATIGPLPRLKMNQAENGEDVIAAIAAYKANHTAEQTEEVIHRWYDEYDSELADAINQNQEITATREANVTYGYDLCQYQGYTDPDSYRKCQAERIADMRGAQHDQLEMSRNNQWILRLQHSLMNIRVRLMTMGLHYDWFKIRTTNGIDRF